MKRAPEGSGQAMRVPLTKEEDKIGEFHMAIKEQI